MSEGHVDIEFKVEPNYSGYRLDRYLCAKIRRLSRTRAQRIIRRGLISARKLKPSTRVLPGLTFSIRRPVLEEPASPTDIREVYLDDHLLVLDKPAGLPIHPTARYLQNTLVSLLRTAYGSDFQASPAHRLDRETSGLVVCGRSSETCRSLMNAFSAGLVHKEYLAIAEGWPTSDDFFIDAPIAEGTKAVRIAVRIDSKVGKPARTRFVVVRRFCRAGERFSLVRAYPQTGRQHQIRIHLRECGFPIVGDKIYGPNPEYFDRFSKRCLEPEAWERLRLPRHALHAARIVIPHPQSGRPVEFVSDLPQDLAQFIDDTEASAAA